MSNAPSPTITIEEYNIIILLVKFQVRGNIYGEREVIVRNNNLICFN